MGSETSKTQLRARIRSQRAANVALASPASTGASKIAATAWDLITSKWLDFTGKSLLAYAALEGEPDLDPFIDRFLARGGTVYLPVVTKVGRPLSFGEVTGSMATIVPRGKWGIREPEATLTPVELTTAEVGLDLIFVPALGFGEGGARLGNGGGFYDRTFGPLGELPLGVGKLETITPGIHPPMYGVCFSHELNLPDLNVEPWDLQILQALTESGVHEFS